jgi:biotin carboxylase
MDDTYKQGKGQSLELMRDKFTMQEICANKFVPEIRKRKKATTNCNIYWTNEK